MIGYSKGEDFMIRLFTMNDYDEVYQLWKSTPGVGLRSLDDSREGIAQFIRRNPTTNFVAIEDDCVVGVTLSGHDGRRGFLYHTCVENSYRQRSLGKQLVQHVIEAMKAEKITKLALVCFTENNPGNHFWNTLGWQMRTDLNYYTISIDGNYE
ncbi:MAG: N-acetylglutamate synthase [Herbinix sp.]|jgi:ribosomal protein S18 acetylase RimI-like enzyme|nr:N-acetylglutamate synthase [Herbinix sp.]